MKLATFTTCKNCNFKNIIFLFDSKNFCQIKLSVTQLTYKCVNNYEVGSNMLSLLYYFFFYFLKQYILKVLVFFF